MHKFQSLSSRKFFAAILGAALLLSTGCEKESAESFDKLFSKTLEQVGNLNPDDASKEFKKLSQFEYRVISFKKEIAIAELEIQLRAFGANGFDCADPIQRLEDLILICKRRPESLLRYIPQTFVGRP